MLLVEAVKKRLGSVSVDVAGQATMSRSGATLIEELDSTPVMGLAEGLGSISAHYGLLKRLRRRFAAGQYDLVVLIDYPGFHLRVAAAASALGVPVLYYVAPQLWAWGAWRARSIRRYVRKLAVVLPFEQQYFRKKGIDAEFVGHPLMDMKPLPSQTEARSRLGIPQDAAVIGLLPGSRPGEIQVLWPRFRDAARRLGDTIPGLRVLVAAVEGSVYPESSGFEVIRGDSASLLAASTAVLCKSGTATLEAALCDTPMVIAYRVHPITYAVARLAVTTKHIGLANLITERQECPELLQGCATPEALADSIRPLFDSSSPETKRQREMFGDIRDSIGGPGATDRVAALVESMVAC